MAKKRKTGGRPFGHERTDDVPEGHSKLRINTYEDVANSEDEFFINQDKILLEEGPAQKKQRKLEEDGKPPPFLDFSDEEILAESPDTSEPEEVEEDDDGRPRKKSKLSEGHFPQDSDSEGVTDRDDDESDGWGTSKQDYYNADIIETEADALEEEAEARRLQQKQLQGMTEEDFGFDEAEWREADKPDAEDGNENERENLTFEVLPQLEITDAMDPEERLKILRTRYPEFEPLAKEFTELQTVHEDLKLAASAATTVQRHLQSQVNGDEVKTPIEVVKYGALSAYLAALCMYFALLTSTTAGDDGQRIAMPPAELRNHTIMETLVQCRELWRKVKDVPVPDLNGLSNGHSELLDGDASLQQTPPVEDQNTENIEGVAQPKEEKKARRTKAQKALLKAQAKAQVARLERIKKTEQDLVGLTALVSRKANKSVFPRTRNSASPSDFGEQTSLTPHEAAEKAKRKKSLRFYTSQIAQKAQKRNDAGRDAGGDNDLPYRERLRDRQARLNAEAEGRGKKRNGANGAALGGESDEEDQHVADELRGVEEEEDYYGLVSARSAAKKAQKANAALADSTAANRNRLQRIDEEGELDGKRAITYAIEKNKGLAPRRKKDVRNPRVKKRKKYEDKKKKLGSIRQVYKGGEGKGGYGGEKTGIKKGLVRSVKL
ncbi:hypothetical protein MMC07_003688 [Pseudocyphellaria aurata]|nr:hypothetical protein [Pseudocyphellaria aurata]